MIAVGPKLDGSTLLRAQLLGVSDESWQQFIHALTIGTDGNPRSFGARTTAGGYGCFDLRPRRLADLGLMRRIRVDNSSGRCFTVGDFVLPMTETKFLLSPLAQYNTLLESLRRYDKLPTMLGISRSGSLALRHRLGPNAATKWVAHQEPSTTALLKRTNDLC